MSRDEDVARAFHEAYERLAPSFGYETRKASAVPWEDVPATNKALMVAVAGEVRALLADTPSVEPAGLDAAWREAEAALPEGQWLLELVRFGIGPGTVNPDTGRTITAYEHPYQASAGRHFSTDEAIEAWGDTPVEALRALTALLPTQASDSPEKP